MPIDPSEQQLSELLMWLRQRLSGMPSRELFPAVSLVSPHLVSHRRRTRTVLNDRASTVERRG